MSEISRRSFLKMSGLTAGALVVFGAEYPRVFANHYVGDSTISIDGISEVADRLRVEKMSLTPTLKERINRQGFSPVTNMDGSELGVIFDADGFYSCLVNHPGSLPTYKGGAVKLGSEHGAVLYGDWWMKQVKAKVLSLLPLGKNIDDIVCAGAIMTESNNAADIGAYEIIVMRRSTGELIRSIRAEFPGNRNIEVVWRKNSPVWIVDGNELSFSSK